MEKLNTPEQATSRSAPSSREGKGSRVLIKVLSIFMAPEFAPAQSDSESSTERRLGDVSASEINRGLDLDLDRAAAQHDEFRVTRVDADEKVS